MFGKVGLYKEKTCEGIQWRVRWFGDYDPNTGKQKRYGKTFTFKKDAEQFQESKKSELKQGIARDPSRETLKEFSERWLHNKIKIENIRPATVILYRGTFDRLYDFFGEGFPICKINRDAAENFLASLQPKTSAKSDLSGWSKHRVLRHCKTLFGSMPVNPFKGIKGAKCMPSEWYYAKADEYIKLLDATPSLREKVLYALCFTAGLRKTEAITLRWADVDFEKGRVHVVNQSGTDKLPAFDIKDSEMRTIPIPKHTLDLLTQLQMEAPDGVPYILLTKERYNKVIENWKRFRLIDRSWISGDWANGIDKIFKRRVKAAGIDTTGKRFSIHDLRKCCIQNWRNSLPSNVVKAFAGHSSIETTEKFYSTVDEGQFDNAARVSNELLNKADTKTTDLFLTFSPVEIDKTTVFNNIPVAQLDRALASEAKGYAFESHRG